MTVVQLLNYLVKLEAKHNVATININKTYRNKKKETLKIDYRGKLFAWAKLLDIYI
jgi:hypothetical protein